MTGELRTHLLAVGNPGKPTTFALRKTLLAWLNSAQGCDRIECSQALSLVGSVPANRLPPYLPASLLPQMCQGLRHHRLVFRASNYPYRPLLIIFIISTTYFYALTIFYRFQLSSAAFNYKYN